MKIAIISDGKLYGVDSKNKPEEIESHFMLKKREEMDRHTAIHSWKTAKGGSTDPYFGQQSVWGGQAVLQDEFRFSNVCSDKEGALFYTMRNREVTGFFKHIYSEKRELRFFHRNDFFEDGFDYSPQDRQFCMALANKDGSVNLKLMDHEGSPVRALTAGDSRDTHPTFSRKNSGEVLYQSSGIARNEDGYVVAIGPESVLRLNIKSGDITEILSNENYDYLLPREDREGNLFFIRRPYEGHGKVGAVDSIKNFLMFPVRLFYAVIGFLNAFINIFDKKTPKPLGPNVDLSNRRQYKTVLGRMIDVSQADRNATKEDGPSLVPHKWELVMRAGDGTEQVIAKNVLSYDIDHDGWVYYTNGFRVFRKRGSEKEFLLKHEIIEKVACCSVREEEP